MLTIITQNDIAAFRQQLGGAPLGFVPTMGALHEGHLSLVNMAKSNCENVVVSIFVNPTQFGPNEDFARYPRTLAQDIEMLKDTNVTAVYLPNTATMYPDGYQTYVANRGLNHILCGVSRPQFFDGVATVVLKLFNLMKPQKAFFGKKDYQQLKVIQNMVRDLHLDIEVIPGDTIRADDGLALSSRNRYLSSEERAQATILYQSMQQLQGLVQNGETRLGTLNDEWRKILKRAPACDLDYAEIRRQSSLASFGELLDEPAVALIAARFGQTRLIDNLELRGSI